MSATYFYRIIPSENPETELPTAGKLSELGLEDLA
jgi:hypothetical protein